jgi:hypothetical protein
MTRRTFVSALVIGVPLFAALVAWAGMEAYASAHPGRLAIITISEGQTFEFSLNHDTREVITTPLGTNTVVIEGGTIRMESADCPGQDCVEHDAIDHVGQSIICLPHRLVVAISEQAPSDLDPTNPPDSPNTFDTIAR